MRVWIGPESGHGEELAGFHLRREENVYLEPIAKLLEEHSDAGELHKPEEVGDIVLPANQSVPFSLEPGKEPFDEPATFISAQVAPILSLEFAGRPMRGNQVAPVCLRSSSRPSLSCARSPMRCSGFAFEHVEVEAKLDQGDLMMIRCMPLTESGSPW